MTEHEDTAMEIQFKDFIRPLKGIFELTVFKNGKMIEHTREENLIVDGARVQMAHLIAGEVTNRQLAKIAFGTSGTAATVTDTVITNAFAKAVSGFTYPEAGQVKFSWNLTTAEDNGQAILEFGLLCADGTLFSRRTRTKSINKESDISMTGSWTIVY
jgi:hypothetical protein